MEIIISTLFIITFFLSFPPFSAFFLMPISLYLSFFLYYERKYGNFKIFLLWWIAEFSILYWISYAIAHYGGVNSFIGLLPTILLTAYLALYPLLFFMLTAKVRESILFPLYSASFWVILDYVKAHFLSGFPWEVIGYSVFPFKPLMNVGDLGGIYLIEFIIILFVSSFFTNKNKKRWIVYSSLVLAAAIIYGEVDYLYWNHRIKKYPSLIAGIAQGNIDQSVKWDRSYIRRTLDIYFSLTDKLSKEGAKLIVWPETSVPFYFQSNPLSRRIKEIAKKDKSYLLIGAPAYTYSGYKTYYLNRAYMISPDGEVLDYYDKVHLVPFGEYLPFEKYLKFVEKIIPMVGNMSPGKVIKPLPVENHQIGVLICYESIFPEISREMVEKGAEILSNITDDAWFGKTSAPFQHFSIAAFRAVEFKRFLVRSANTGISGIISPTGDIIKWTPIFKEASITGRVRFINFKTSYERFGDWIVFLSILILVVEGFLLLFEKSHR